MSRPERLKLYEIPLMFQAIDAALDASEGEVTPQIEAMMTEAGGELADKVDAVGSLVADYDVRAAAMGGAVERVKAELDRLKARQQALHNRGESLKYLLRRTLAQAGKDKVEGKVFTARPARAASPRIEWTFPGGKDVPAEFRRVQFALDGKAAQDFYREHKALPEGFKVTFTEYLSLR